jgi:malonyl-CoA O-methyltransferase
MPYKQKIIKSFNSGAYHYNRAADIQPQVARQLAQYLQGLEANTVLEIGCGTGLYSQYLPEHFPDAKLILSDIAPSMLEHCHMRMQQYSNVSLIHLDGEAVELPIEFDLITSCMVFHWFLNFKQSIQQLMAKLAPRGRILFAMLGENSLQEWREICNENALMPTPSFISVANLQQSFPDLKIHVELVKQFYQNAYEFLKTLKLIGAGVPHIKHIAITTTALRKVMRLLDEKYPQGINISYEIIFGNYEKK